MGEESILIVEDNPDILHNLSEIIKSSGFPVEQATDGQIALGKLKSNVFDLIIMDLNLPLINGMDILKFIQDEDLDVVSIVITGYGSIQGAVEAMKMGAFDYLTKPVSAKEILLVVERALDMRSIKRENLSLKQELKSLSGFNRIIGKSKAMREIFALIDKVSKTDSTILITGESGTGKELVAHAVHNASPRKDMPFVPVNCAAIPTELLESELFGHEKGAFTHAIRTRIGRFELANKGTIFLDEIGDMPLPLQVKLLRVLQERCFERVGGARTIHTDIRIISASNSNLEEAVKKGTFREDLYYRLNVIPIKLPPLRERLADIPLLIDHFLKKFISQKDIHIKGFDKKALKCLMSYDWPGNVRELENLVERVVILSSGPYITVNDLPEKFREKTMENTIIKKALQIPSIPKEGLSLSSMVNEFEKAIILQALERSNWVKARAAKLLRLNRTTLIEKMKKQNLSYPKVINE